MMPNIVQGGNTIGLMLYLTGPGRANEHTSPHIVAGDDMLMDRWGEWESLTPAQAVEMAHALDRYMVAFGVSPKGMVRRFDPETESTVVVKQAPNHVWHCSLSLSPEEGKISEEKWRAIATDFMTEMGFTGEDGKAPCRWVAVHHGASKNGGDHIHIVATIVRGDGTKWSTYYDQKRSQRACNRLEHKYGLQVLESREHARGARADSPQDLRATHKRDEARVRAIQEREGRFEVATDRARLESRVRAAAVAARDEAEFVSLLRDYGVRVRPRFAEGRTDIISGYSVALASYDPTKRAQWYGGGRLARDLALPRLRARWADTPTGAQRAAIAWRQAWNGERVTGVEKSVATHAKRETMVADWRVNVALLRAWRERMIQINPLDPVALADVTRDVSGLLASAGVATDDGYATHVLMRASRCIGRHAQTHQRPSYRAPGSHAVSSAARALLRARSRGELQAALLAAEIVELSRSLSALYLQAGQTHTAQAILHDTQAAWTMLHQPSESLTYCRQALTGEHVTRQRDSAGRITAVVERTEPTPVIVVARAADTSKELKFDTASDDETCRNAVLASGLRDVLDAHPEIMAVTVGRDQAMMDDGSLTPVADFKAISYEMASLPEVNQALNAVVDQCWAPVLFVDRMAGQAYSREQFALEVDRPLMVAAARFDPNAPHLRRQHSPGQQTTSQQAVTPAGQADEISAEQADRIRSMSAAAMPINPSRQRSTPTNGAPRKHPSWPGMDQSRQRGYGL